MAKQLDVVTGLVERINDKGTGLRLNGEWANSSQYANPLIEMPKVGQRVNMTVERTDGRGIWIQSVEVLDDGQIHQLPQQQQRRGGGGGRSPAELRDIRRLSVLKAAAAFGASRPDMKSADVLTLADRWITWVEKGGDQSN
jgi:hypothetical protein